MTIGPLLEAAETEARHRLEILRSSLLLVYVES